MAVGKGSMARASKAAVRTTTPKETKAAEEVKVEVAVVAEPTKKAAATKTTTAKTTASKTKKTTTRKTTAKKATTKVTSSVVTGTSEQVMQAIEYQKSSQVLDREPEMNETFGVGESMPIYFY